MFHTLKNWFCCAWLPLYFGGDSSSQANQTQTTETQDNRIASAVGSANLSNARGTIGGNVNLTTISTDNGAVNRAFNFAGQENQSAFKFATNADDKALKFATAGNKDMLKFATAADKAAFSFADTQDKRAFSLTDKTLSRAFDLTENMTNHAANETAASLGAVQQASTGALQAVQSAYSDTTKTIADAYTTSKAGEQKVLVGGALALLAIVGIKVFGKHA